MNKPPFEINDTIINRLADITTKLGGLGAIANKKMDLHLRKAGVIRMISSSCAIEANTLTEQQVEGIINGKRIIAPVRDIIEIMNAYEAYTAIDDIEPYETSSFLKAHGMIVKQLAEDAGMYRDGDVGVYDNGMIVHMGARPQFVPGLMDELFKWAETSQLNPIIKACVMHYEIETVHPFSDGNGRIGRLWQSVILCRYNELFKLMPIETLVYENRQRYYDSIEASRKENSSTPFIEFMMEMISKTIDAFGIDGDRLPGLNKEHLKKLNKGEKEMLRNIVSNFNEDEKITTGQLSETTYYSNSAIRNHLKKLTDEKILIASGENKGRKYVLNKKVFSP